MKKNIYQKNNKTYLKKKVQDKEYFKDITKYLKKYKTQLDLIDVGCASGDFLKNLSKQKNFNLTGVDFSKKLISLARTKVPSANFFVKDIKKINLKKKFNICTCLGTLSVFDDKFKIISKLINMTKNKGELIFFDPINNYNVNVIMRYQDNFKKNSKWLSAFNIFSKEHWISNIIKNKKVKNVKFTKFKFPFPLKRSLKNPMNAWTFKLKNENQIMTGTGQLLNFYIIKIKLI